METRAQNTSVDHYYRALLALEPKLITNTVPSNATDQKKRFIADEIHYPEHIYPKLEIEDKQLDDISRVGDKLLKASDLDAKHTSVYEDFIAGYERKTRLMQLMHQVKNSSSDNEKQEARQEFMRLNTELYGEPDHDTYVSLLQEKIAAIQTKNLSKEAGIVYEELVDMIPDKYILSDKVERFNPSTETIAWMSGAVGALYNHMLVRIPEKATFDVSEVRAIFDSILKEEFEGAASQWRVDIEDAKSINVNSTEKRVVIPTNRGELSRDTVRRLVVHELGVHVFRSVTGGESDVGPLRIGLDNYYDVEEGLGKVMEQALVGTFAEAGIEHYITAGAAYRDKKDFRDVFEMKWRLRLLSGMEDDEVPAEPAIVKAKNAAYSGVMRIFRGTDELPWFKDLAYYNGSAEVWNYLESIRGDNFKLMLLMMGKINTGRDHLRTILESKTA